MQHESNGVGSQGTRQAVSRVEKGQKYKGGNGGIYEILSDPFEFNGEPYVAYTSFSYTNPAASKASIFLSESFTLIREPRFKVGDRVTHLGYTYKIVAASSETDLDGNFGYLGFHLSDEYFEALSDSNALKAAE